MEETLDSRIAKIHRRTATAVLTKSALLLTLCALAIPVARAQTYTYSVLYEFLGTFDGAFPLGGVIMDSKGNLYGTTSNGGAITGGLRAGTVFKLDASGLTTLHTFNGADGAQPVGSLVQDAAGNLYGITSYNGSGTVFKLALDASGNPTVFTVLYNVPGASCAGLIRDTAGNLYGTTCNGGDYGQGTVFKLGLDGSGNPTVPTVLHSFGGPATDGTSPQARLCLGPAGLLYGTTYTGGAFGVGTVFQVDTSGANYAVLHSFTGTSDEGGHPFAGVIMDPAGNLYGATSYSGVSPNSWGAVFKLGLDASGNPTVPTVLYKFTGGADGGGSIFDLVRDAAGNLYGTTTNGVPGTVFKLDTTNALTTLYAFGDDVASGIIPRAGLFMDAAGNLYGTTMFGGTNAGVVFKLTAPPAQHLDNFTAQVYVTRLLHSTAVAGQFHSSTSIDPTNEPVSLSVAGTNGSNWILSTSTFKKVLGVYLASAKSGSTSITMSLVPLKGGNWDYSAAILGFVPGSTSVTVSLAIGAQSGSATVNAHVF